MNLIFFVCLMPHKSMSTGFDPNQESYFLIHGFNSNAENFRMQVIKKELSKYVNLKSSFFFL